MVCTLLFFILPCVSAYLFLYLIPAAPFAVNAVHIVDILIPPISVLCIILLFCTFRWASALFHFTAHPVCVCDNETFWILNLESYIHTCIHTETPSIITQPLHIISNNVVTCSQETACWMHQIRPCRCPESCRASRIAWTANASKSSEKSSSTVPTCPTAPPALSSGATRTANTTAPPRTAACPGPMAPPATAPMGPVFMGCAWPPRRLGSHWWERAFTLMNNQHQSLRYFIIYISLYSSAYI